MTREDKELLDECKFLLQSYGRKVSVNRWLKKLEEIVEIVEAVDSVKFKKDGVLVDIRKNPLTTVLNQGE